MKNNAFKITLYSGIIMFTLIILLSISVLLNVYNFVEPKIFKLINYEKEKYVNTVSTSNENLIMEINLPEFDTIPKPIQSDNQPKIFVAPMIESKFALDKFLISLESIEFISFLLDLPDWSAPIWRFSLFPLDFFDNHYV